MKLRRKQLTLGVLATIAAIAVPVATVVSCGSKKSEAKKSGSTSTTGTSTQKQIDTSKFDKFVISDLVAQAFKSKSPTMKMAEEGKKFENFMKAHMDMTKKVATKNFVLEYKGKEYVFTTKMTQKEGLKVFNSLAKVLGMPMMTSK